MLICNLCKKEFKYKSKLNRHKNSKKLCIEDKKNIIVKYVN